MDQEVPGLPRRYSAMPPPPKNSKKLNSWKIFQIKILYPPNIMEVHTLLFLITVILLAKFDEMHLAQYNSALKVFCLYLLDVHGVGNLVFFLCSM